MAQFKPANMHIYTERTHLCLVSGSLCLLGTARTSLVSTPTMLSSGSRVPQKHLVFKGTAAA